MPLPEIEASNSQLQHATEMVRKDCEEKLQEAVIIATSNRPEVQDLEEVGHSTFFIVCSRFCGYHGWLLQNLPLFLLSFCCSTITELKRLSEIPVLAS